MFVFVDLQKEELELLLTIRKKARTTKLQFLGNKLAIADKLCTVDELRSGNHLTD